MVFVGDPAHAPGDCAALLPLTDWPAWKLTDLELASLEDGVLPCPHGDSGSASTERALPGACLRSLAFLLHREEERLDTRRDQWGCFSGFSTRLGEWGVLDRPIVNQWALQLSRRVRAWAERRNHRLAEVPRWKNGKRFAVALTHDVDWVRRYSVRQSLRLLGQARKPGSYAFRHGLRSTAEAIVHFADRSDPYCTFDRWMSEEAGHGFRSTFLFCPPHPKPRHEYDPTYLETDRVQFRGRAMTVAGLMRAIAAAECEVGLHASYESYVRSEELSRQREQIERAARIPIRGVRQHFLRFDIGRTWEAQERAGFAYDSTLGYNEAVGFRAGVGAPFHPWNPATRDERTLLELPMTLMDGTLFRTLKLTAAGAVERIRAHFDAIEQVGGLAVLLWHPNATDESAFPGWWDAYREALQDLAGRDAWVAPAGEIAAWWLERGRQMDSASSQ
ncbi:MAG: polysaccharide deacetylase family protein [Candidatus Eisenbacteria bacterium]|nr:polysaccharide deacetylase family protein [Candidatus Eisenbacteria bacterium]